MGYHDAHTVVNIGEIINAKPRVFFEEKHGLRNIFFVRFYSSDREKYIITVDFEAKNNVWEI